MDELSQNNEQIEAVGDVDVSQQKAMVDVAHRKFTDLNVDCMLLILEQLNFVNLLSVAQTNEKLSSLAAAVFKQKYSNMTVIISYGLGYHEFLDRIDIVDPEMSLQTLKHFGHMIQTLRLTIPKIETNQTKLLVQKVNEICSESLKTFALEVPYGYTLHDIKVPFKNVERLVLVQHLPLIGSNCLTMNATFPAVRQISFRTFYFDKMDKISGYFPHLEHIDLLISDISGVEELLKANSHIRSIYLAETPFGFMKTINRLLPNLEVLICDEMKHLPIPVRFENVRRFELRGSYDSPEKMIFPKLREVSMNLRTERYDDWVTFLRNHDQVTKFHLTGIELPNSQFEGLTAVLPTIEDMTISTLIMSEIDKGVLFRFFENHSQLLRFEIDHLSGENKETLRNKFDMEWTFSDTNQKSGILMERKRFECDENL